MIFLVILALLCACREIHGEALTYRISSYENTCFYQAVDNPEDKKVFFYFAVQKAATASDSIDVTVTSPNGNILWSTRSVYGDQSFEKLEAGEYRFCFNNGGSFSSKTIDFDITVSVEDEWTRPSATPFSSPRSSALEQSLTNLGVELRTLRSYQRYFKQRDSRNMSTVKATLSLVKWMTLLQIISTIAGSYFQGTLIDEMFASSHAVRV